MTLTTINSGGVKDDSIVNADIKSDAAIAGSKIVPTFNTNLDVTGNITTTGIINLGVADTSSGHINAAELMTFNIDTDNDDTNRYFGFYKDGLSSGGTELFRIQEDGKVGIGTASPTSAGSYTKFLHISDNNSASVAISRSASGSAHSLELGAFNSASLIESTGATSLRFKTNGNEALRITSDGDMGLGTGGNTVTQRLDVRESNSTVFNPTSNLPTIARLYNTSSTNGASAGLQLRTDNNNGAAGMQYIHAVNSSTNYDSDLVFSRRLATSGSYAEACRITNAGNLKFPSEKGIDFSATSEGSGNSQDEIFTDYEKGRWVPTANDGCAGFTYTASRCVYTLVGKKVTLWARIVNPTSVNSGTFEISGLPFTPADHTVGSGMFNSFNIGNTRTNGTAQLNPFVVAAGVNVIRLYFSGLAGDDTWLAILGDHVTSNGDMYFTVSYWIA